MSVRPILDASALSGQLDEVTVLDVRWTITGGARRNEYLAGHVPTARFVELDRDLSGPQAADGKGGRHPLPRAEAFTAAMRAAGVDADRPVVAYDAGAGAAAARCWWLLRYFGHEDVAL